MLGGVFVRHLVGRFRTDEAEAIVRQLTKVD
jgi:hypothetical protein